MADEPIAEEVKEHIKDGSVWLRLLYMILFAIIYCVAEAVLTAVVVFQFLWVLFTGGRNEKLLALGGQLSTFIYQVLRFLTYNSDVKPYPFDEWPAAEPAKAETSASEAPQAQTESQAAETPAAKPKAAPKRVRKPAAKKVEPKAEEKPEGKAADSGDKPGETSDK